MNARSLNAFVFDVDGVLADTAGLHTGAWREAVEHEGLIFPETVANDLRGRTRRDSLKMILGRQPIAQARFDRILVRKNDLYRERLSTLTPADCLPGVRALLHELSRNGFKIAAVSASQNAFEVLRRLALCDLFDVKLDGTPPSGLPTTMHRFERAAAELGCAPETCVVVEDAAANILIARQIGMSTIGIGEVNELSAADAVIRSFDGIGLLELLRILFPASSQATGRGEKAPAA